MPIFFTYSESPSNSLIDEGLKFKNYPMGIEVMAVLMKLLANARREGDTTTSKQESKHSNSMIILYKIAGVFMPTWPYIQSAAKAMPISLLMPNWCVVKGTYSNKLWVTRVWGRCMSYLSRVIFAYFIFAYHFVMSWF